MIEFEPGKEVRCASHRSNDKPWGSDLECMPIVSALQECSNTRVLRVLSTTQGRKLRKLEYIGSTLDPEHQNIAHLSWFSLWYRWLRVADIA